MSPTKTILIATELKATTTLIVDDTAYISTSINGPRAFPCKPASQDLGMISGCELVVVSAGLLICKDRRVVESGIGRTRCSRNDLRWISRTTCKASPVVEEAGLGFDAVGNTTSSYQHAASRNYTCCRYHRIDFCIDTAS
jgi:hypothetical protein